MNIRFLIITFVISAFAGLTAPKEVLEYYEFFRDYELFENLEILEGTDLNDTSQKLIYEEEISSSCVKNYQQNNSSFSAIHQSTGIVSSSATFGGLYENKK